MDAGKFLRLQGAIRAALASEEPHKVSADSMVGTYLRLRATARDAVPGKDRDEFDALFPEKVEAGSVGTLFDVLREGERGTFFAARSLLETLAGWLGGYVEEARMAMEAAEYAKARVKEERGVGFKSSGLGSGTA